MGLLIYGYNRITIGADECLVKCPCCEQYRSADILVHSVYAHFYWIPFFPFDKQADVICRHCGLRRYGLSFDANLIPDYVEVKRTFRHPWLTYLGGAVFILIVVFCILASLHRFL
ncbi:MAG TPA: hypothetical protein VHK91_04155 [Flavisolibacter sp.]|jgi:hypothetical protein|nr:hypothetical protein [Flavisolibacter sp.]